MFALNFFRKLYKMAPNFACFGPNFSGDIPEFLDLHNKAHAEDYNVAKFHGDRLRELGDTVAKL